MLQAALMGNGREIFVLDVGDTTTRYPADLVAVDYADLDGASTASHDDTTAPADGAGRYYRCRVSAPGAGPQTTAADRGYRHAELPAVATAAATARRNPDSRAIARHWR